MKYFFGQLSCLMIALSVISVSNAWPYAGPLQTANRFPLHMLVLTPRPVAAQTPAQGQAEATMALEYSSIFYDYRNDRWDFLIDMEILVVDLSMVYGITDNLAIRLDLPFVSMRDGFLDGFLQNYHDALGVSNYGREDRPTDTFAYRATKDGTLWIQGESDALKLGEVRVSTQVGFPPASMGGGILHSAALFTVKLPTGDSNQGMGSGETDVGFYLPVQWNRMQWSFFLMPGTAWISDPETLGAQVSARNSLSLFAGAAWRSSSQWCWLVQANYYSSPFESSGLNELDTGALELSLGFQRSISNALSLEFVFSEDLTRPVPDFNLRLGLTWKFGVGGDEREEGKP